MYEWLASWWTTPPEEEEEAESELEEEIPETPGSRVALKYKILTLCLVMIGLMSSGLAVSALFVHFFTNETHFLVDKVAPDWAIIGRQLNFSDAQDYCAEHFPTGRLAVVNSEEEEDLLMKKVKEEVVEDEEVSMCQALLIGYRANASRKWQSLDHRSFLPTLNVPMPQPISDDSSDCIAINLDTSVAKSVPCFRRFPCALCETLVNCSSLQNSLEEGCYKLEVEPVHTDEPPTQNPGTTNVTTQNVTNVQELIFGTGEERRLRKKRQYVGLLFNEWQLLCWKKHQGRLAAFLRKETFEEVRQEIRYLLKIQNSEVNCKETVAARLVEKAYEYATAKGERLSYRSKLIPGGPSEHECLAIQPRDQFNWLPASCHQNMCFVCNKG